MGHKKKKLYCLLVDYKKAFDLVWREALWYKMSKNGITGKVLDVIKSMYANIKSCVSLGGEQSDYFISLKGVRQGETCHHCYSHCLLMTWKRV